MHDRLVSSHIINTNSAIFEACGHDQISVSSTADINFRYSPIVKVLLKDRGASVDVPPSYSAFFVTRDAKTVVPFELKYSVAVTLE